SGLHSSGPDIRRLAPSVQDGCAFPYPLGSPPSLPLRYPGCPPLFQAAPTGGRGWAFGSTLRIFLFSQENQASPPPWQMSFQNHLRKPLFHSLFLPPFFKIFIHKQPKLIVADHTHTPNP